ncbi:MAG: hypothetical protein ACREX3_08365 [Gammaproteobacteria bacterium]
MPTDASLYGSSAERAFSILAWTLTLPWMLPGFLFFGLFGVHQLIELEKSALPMLALTLAGLVGLTGLLGSYFASAHTSVRSIDARTACLLVGVVSSLVLAGYLTVNLLPEFGLTPAGVLLMLLLGPIEFVLLAAEGCMAVRRLGKARRCGNGRAGAVPSVDSLMLATTVLIALVVLTCSGFE